MLIGNTAVDIHGFRFKTEMFDDETYLDTKYFIEDVKQTNLLPFDGVEIHYSDESWDFRAKKKKVPNVPKSSFYFSFSDCPDTYLDDLKNFVLISIIENIKKIPSINAAMSTTKKFFQFAYENNYFYVKDLTPEIITKWIGSFKNIKKQTLNAYSTQLKEFIDFYDNNIGNLFTNKHYDALKVIEWDELKTIKENHKTPNMQEDLFDNILETALKVMLDEETEKFYRGMSALIVIECEVALRSGELFALEEGCIKPVSIFNGETAYYMEYKTWKREEGNSTVTTEITYVNELVKKAYDILVDLYKDRRKEWHLPYLFLDSKSKPSPENYPLDSTQARFRMLQTFIYYNTYFQTIFDKPSQNPAVNTVKRYSNNDLSVKKIKRSQQYIVLPTSAQYRVHMCSSLYERGVPKEYVEKFMSHLSSEMDYYYARPKSTPQEDMEIALKTLSDLVTGEVTPLGQDKGLMDKIRKFIKENNYDVRKDLETICADLAEDIPIRIKTGGVCIKSSLDRECFVDSSTDEFYCAYGVCPNIYTFYYMITVSYRQYQELKEAIQANRKMGHERQAEKNENMMRTIITKKMQPQLEDLKEKISKFGVSHILEEHPDLIEIIQRIPEIEKELQEDL